MNFQYFYYWLIGNEFGVSLLRDAGYFFKK